MNYRLLFGIFFLSFFSLVRSEDLFADLENDIGDMLSMEETTRRFAFIPKIKQRTDTLKIAIGQTDVTDGKIVLSKTAAYCPHDLNITADIEITGTNIMLDFAGRSLFGKITVSGDSALIKNCVIVALPATSLEDAQTAALTIHANTRGTSIKKCHVECIDSVLSTTFIPSVPGRSGIEICGSIVSVYDCSIIAGASTNSSSTNSDDGGCGIVVSGTANKVRIRDCILKSGNAGNSTNGNGGNGGYGIYLKDTVSEIEIEACTVFSTGNGGNGSVSGGNGGDGIRIESGAADVEVHHCKIRNTGAGGSPGGAGGKAIDDDIVLVGSEAICHTNFAQRISNTIKFDLLGTNLEQGVLLPNPISGIPVHQYANVYMS